MSPFTKTANLRECRRVGRDGNVERWVQQLVIWSDGREEWRDLPVHTLPYTEPK